MDFTALERTLYGAISQALAEFADDLSGVPYHNIDRFMGVCVDSSGARVCGGVYRTSALAVANIPEAKNGKTEGSYTCVERSRYKCFKGVRNDVLKSNPEKDPDEIILSKEMYNKTLTEISTVFSKEYCADDSPKIGE